MNRTADTPRFLAAGDTALVVEFGRVIDRAVSERVLALRDRVQAAALEGVVELVPSFRSLMVHYDPLRTGNARLTSAIRELLAGQTAASRTARLWRIPACYEGQHAPDLEDVARRTGLATAEVVRLHAQTRYHVYMIGFLPGYPYLGDVPEALRLPRRSDPRVRVPAGAVAIAAAMTGVYPVESPGGWHLIGNTPVRLFDAGRPQPALLAPGDAVCFEPVSAAEHDRLRRRVQAGDLQIEGEPIAAAPPSGKARAA